MKQVVTILVFTFLIIGCTTNSIEPISGNLSGSEMGNLVFVANGENFVRQGFVSKDGWHITFDHLYVTLSEVAAYQTDPPYDASTGETIDGAAVNLAGPYTLDLAAGNIDTKPLEIGVATNIVTGHYNALSWKMIPAVEGDATGYTVRLEGTAIKPNKRIAFTLNVEDSYSYTCGEYIGETRKGFLIAGGTTNVEATFHFDHVFGNGDAPLDDSLNVRALGFTPLATAADGDMLKADLAALEEMLSETDMTTLRNTLSTLGHVGEGHCYEATGGFTGHVAP